jgi:hypothetical protein
MAAPVRIGGHFSERVIAPEPNLNVQLLSLQHGDVLVRRLMLVLAAFSSLGRLWLDLVFGRIESDSSLKAENRRPLTSSQPSRQSGLESGDRSSPKSLGDYRPLVLSGRRQRDDLHKARLTAFAFQSRRRSAKEH